MDTRFRSGGFQLYQPGQVTPLPGYAGSPLNDWMAELEREAYFGNWLGKQGYMGLDQQGALGRSLLNEFNLGYESSLFDDPEYKWTDYLASKTGQLPKIMAGIDPRSRGYSPASFASTDAARWLKRSR